EEECQAYPTLSQSGRVGGHGVLDPKDPCPLPNAVWRFFAPRSSPLPHPEDFTIRARWPDMAAAVLREANCSLPRSFTALVNDKGSVTLVVADTLVPTSSYAPYFEALTTKLNQSFRVGDNP